VEGEKSVWAVTRKLAQERRDREAQEKDDPSSTPPPDLAIENLTITALPVMDLGQEDDEELETCGPRRNIGELTTPLRMFMSAWIQRCE
jgi:hypothetical protein